MIDEEWMSANLGPLSSDAPGTYTGDRIEELEEEVKRLRRMLGYTDAADDERSRFGSIAVRLDEYDRLREIEEAAREYTECYQRTGDLRKLQAALTREGTK